MSDDASMGMSTLAVIGALPEEVAGVSAALDAVQVRQAASLSMHEGVLEREGGKSALRVAAAVGGMGLVNAAATTQYLIDAYQPSAVIFSGIAGNLNAALRVNDVVLGATLRYLDTDMALIGQWKPQTAEFHSDARLLALADAQLTRLGIRHIAGVIASGNHFIDTPEQVARVREQTHADAVEMEGAAVAHVAARNDVPALVIRALSDDADTQYEEFRHFDVTQYADTAAIVTLGILQNY